MIIGKLRTLLFGTLRRQLIISVTVIHAVLMSLFVWDVIEQQHEILLERQTDMVSALAGSIATSSAVRIDSRDLAGLQELVDIQKDYPNLNFVTVLDRQGAVLAHAGRQHTGQSVPGLPLIPEPRILDKSLVLVDIVTPVMTKNRHVGWVRVGIGLDSSHQQLDQQLELHGIFYVLMAILAGGLLAVLLAKRMTRRLDNIQSVADAVQSGLAGVRVRMEGSDEAAQLAQQFNHMLDTLAEREREMIAARDALKLAKIAVDHTRDGAFWIDKEGKIFSINEQACRSLGYTHDELLGMDIWEIDPNLQQASWAPLFERLKNEGSFVIETLHKHKNDTIIDVEVSATYVHYGEREFSFALVRDITDRKNFKRALIESEEKFRCFFENAADPVLLLKEGKFVDCNAATLKLLGYGSKEEFLNATPPSISPLYQPDGRTSAEKSAEMDAIALQEGFNRFEWVHTRVDGSTVPVEVTLTSIIVKGARVLHVLWRDITARKEVEEDLALYRRMIEGSADPFFVIDTDDLCRMIYINDAAMKHFGAPREEVYTWRIPDWDPKFTYEMLPQHVEKMKKSGSINIESVHRVKGGALVPVEISINPINYKGHSCHYGYFRNISERKLAEESLMKLFTAVEQSPVSIVITDLDGTIEYVNRTFVEESGYSFIETIGKNPRILNSGRNSRETYQAMWSCLMRGEVWKGELINRRKDGSEYTESVLISPVHQTDGRITHYLAVKNNISLRKQNEAKIDRLSRAYRLLSRVNESIVRAGSREKLFQDICKIAVESELFRFAWVGMLDEQKLVVEPVAYAGVEEGYTAKLNIRLDDAKTGNGPTGRAIREITHVICADIEHDSHMAPWRDEALKRGYRSSGVFPIYEGFGIVGAINVYAAEAFFFTPDIVSLMLDLAADISFALDVFAEKQHRELAEGKIRQMNLDLERRVMERTIQLESANKELASFSYAVSHDLRAPLRSIDGFSQILAKKYREQLDETGRDYLERVSRASQRMGHLIDDMLRLSQVARGELKKELVNLSSMAEEIAENLHRMQPERDIRVTLQPGLQVYADTGLLRIVMDNLLGNAFKYTGKKQVAEIEFGMCHIDGVDAFFVRDNGAGFNMEYAHKLFGPFQRLHGANEFEGTGIGLATVQRIISRHHGKVWAEAKEGEGATFFFMLPQRARERGEST